MGGSQAAGLGGVTPHQTPASRNCTRSFDGISTAPLPAFKSVGASSGFKYRQP